MTPTEYRKIIGSLSLTQGEAAKLLGASERTGRRWAQYGPTGADEIVWRLLGRGRINIADCLE